VHVPKVQSGVPGTDHRGQADRSQPAAIRERRGHAVGHRGRRLPTISGTAVQLPDTAVLLSVTTKTNLGEAATD